MLLRDRYFERLGFSKEEADVLASKPCKEHLDKIVEAHLDKITFDNLSQHGLPMTASVDAAGKTANKILDHGRGGFCFELNGLLAEFLESELDYKVRRIPAIVNVPEVEFNHPPSHVVLVVSSVPGGGGDADNVGDEEWFVDVGFGEPAIQSLKYELDTEQTTSEGMVSRIVKDPTTEDAVLLEWKQDGVWVPRLKWEYFHPGQPLKEFQSNLEIVLGEDSIFHQKLIVCRVDRQEKVSLAGTKLKRTSPRFGPDVEVTLTDLETPEAVKKALKEVFNVPDPDALDLERSIQAAPEMWSQM